MSYNRNQEELIYHICDDNGNNVLKIEEEVSVTSINSINTSNDISIYDDENVTHIYYAPF